MNKQGLIEAVAAATEESKASAERIVASVLDSVKKGLKKDKGVALVGFGTFSLKQRKARAGRNPKTGQTIQIAASKSVGFKPGKELKDSVR